MIVPMKKVLLVALREDREALARALQRVGEVMPVDPEGDLSGKSENRDAVRAEQALKVVRQYQGRQSLFAQRPQVNYGEFVARNQAAEELLERIESLSAEHDAISGEIAGTSGENSGTPAVDANGHPR